ncbi:hypothetical protein [Leifsonia sp. A12D58]|uniref:hypothetical protein n=1 Tax=Leifsonia sp. A12D58 TaxID=3397674 RepID=UPI0039E0965B
MITARYVLWTLRSPSDALVDWRRQLRPGGILAVIDSTWYLQGLQAVDPAGESARQSGFRELYGDDVLANAT